MNFFQTIGKSIYSPAFYSKIPQKPFGSVLGYYLLLCLLLTFIQLVKPTWDYIKSEDKNGEKFAKQVADVYPSALEITLKNGNVLTNVKEPYFITPPTWDDNETSEDHPTNLIVINTKTPFSVSQFTSYDTAVWIMKDAVIAKSDDSAEMKTYSLAEVPDMTINKTMVQSLIDKFSPWLKFAPLAGLGFLLIALIAYYSWRLLYLLVLALIILLLTKLIRKPLPYAESYKVGLFAMTLGLIVDLLLKWKQVVGFPFQFTLITLAVILVNLLASKKSSWSRSRK